MIFCDIKIGQQFLLLTFTILLNKKKGKYYFSLLNFFCKCILDFLDFEAQ